MLSQVITDFSVSFYEAGLVPAAHVHMAQPQPPPPADAAVLRPEVAALQVRCGSSSVPVYLLTRCCLAGPALLSIDTA
jgi:hypothetical protein